MSSLAVNSCAWQLRKWADIHRNTPVSVQTTWCFPRIWGHVHLVCQLWHFKENYKQSNSIFFCYLHRWPFFFYALVVCSPAVPAPVQPQAETNPPLLKEVLARTMPEPQVHSTTVSIALPGRTTKPPQKPTTLVPIDLPPQTIKSKILQTTTRAPFTISGKCVLCVLMVKIPQLWKSLLSVSSKKSFNL